MEIEKTDIPGLLIIKPNVFSDSRGYFFESFNKQAFNSIGLNVDFVQDNISKSIKSTIRGLHYQTAEKAQGKLCKVISGKVLDVAVDIRFNSPTFGEYYAVELSEENHLMLWIPTGFAHGFSVLSDEAIFSYKCTEFYSKEDERSIRYNDPQLNIDWQVENPIVSEKDLNSLPLSEIEKDFLYNSK